MSSPYSIFLISLFFIFIFLIFFLSSPYYNYYWSSRCPLVRGPLITSFCFVFSLVLNLFILFFFFFGPLITSLQVLTLQRYHKSTVPLLPHYKYPYPLITSTLQYPYPLRSVSQSTVPLPPHYKLTGPYFATLCKMFVLIVSCWRRAKEPRRRQQGPRKSFGISTSVVPRVDVIHLGFRRHFVWDFVLVPRVDVIHLGFRPSFGISTSFR